MGKAGGGAKEETKEQEVGEERGPGGGQEEGRVEEVGPVEEYDRQVSTRVDH